MPPEAKAVEPRIPFSPMPGGALTANTQMMRDNGILNRYSEVIDAMGEVVVKGGFATSVTPVSQFYFQQAFNNVMFGPWKKIAEGYGKMVLGYFGKTPVAPDPEVAKLCQEQLKLEPTERVPVDINDEDPTKGIKPAHALLEAAGLPITDENTFIAATCKEKGIQFLKGEAKIGVRKKEKEEPTSVAAAAPAVAPAVARAGYNVVVNGNPYEVKLKDEIAIVNGVPYVIDVAELKSTETPKPDANQQAAPAERAAATPTGTPAATPADTPADTPPVARAVAPAVAHAVAHAGKAHQVKAPLPGLILRVVAKPGEMVAEGETILVVESMKMETEIHAPVAGSLTEIPVNQGDQVQAGDVLAIIHK